MSSVSRLAQLANFFNTLNTATVRVMFQKSPGKKGSDKRAVKDLQFQVVKNGAVIQSGTAVDGVIDMLVRGGSSTLQLMVNGAPVASYDVSIRTAAVEPHAQLVGRQKRLRMLGYQIGHDGPAGNGVGAAFNTSMDRSILEFQGDKDKKMTGLLDEDTANLLDADAGA